MISEIPYFFDYVNCDLTSQHWRDRRFLSIRCGCSQRAEKDCTFPLRLDYPFAGLPLRWITPSRAVGLGVLNGSAQQLSTDLIQRFAEWGEAHAELAPETAHTVDQLFITGTEDCVEAEALLSQEEAWELGNNPVEERLSLANLYALEELLLFHTP